MKKLLLFLLIFKVNLAFSSEQKSVCEGAGTSIQATNKSASYEGYQRYVQYSKAQKAEPVTYSQWEENGHLLIEASRSGDFTAVCKLLAIGANVNYKDIPDRDREARTALIYASLLGHTKIAEKLIEYGANVDAQDNFGATALMYASSKKNKKIMELLAKCSDVTIKDIYGQDVFDWISDDHELLDFLKSLISGK